MGMFDDLIPQQQQQQQQQQQAPAPQVQAMPTPPISPQQTPNLTAKTQQQAQAQPQQQAQPAPQQGLFDDLIPKQPQNSLAGSIKSIGSGLGHAAAGLGGLPGDITSLVTGGKHGSGFGSEAIQSAIDSNIGKYTPQTKTEQLLEKGGEYLPGMLLPAGDIGLGAKLLRLVAAPAIGSQIGEDLTKGTAAAPYGAMAGGIIGGGVAGKVGDMLSARSVAKANPMQGAEQLGNAATGVYKSPELNAVAFKSDAIGDLQNEMRQAVGNRDPSIANGTHAIINSLNQPSVKADPMSALTGVTPKQPPPVSWSNVQNARTLLGQQAGKFTDPIDQGAATAAKKALDSWLENVPQSSLHAGDASEIKNFFTANKNYQVMSALNMLEGKEYAADLGAAAANSGANFENAMRQRIKGILVSDKQRSQFENLSNGPEVIAAMEKVVRGGTVDNLVRAIGNITGGGGGMHAGILGIGGAMLGHPEAALAPLTGWALKAARNKSINNQLGNIQNMIKQGAPANSAIAATARNALQQRLQGMPPLQRALVNAALARNQGQLIPQQ